jgi:uncharacterized protein YcnI
MTHISRALQRALIPAAVLCVGLFAGTATAAAHVTVNSDEKTPGEWAVLTFEVPNESEKDALTTQLHVTMPVNTSAMAEAVPGWTADLDRDAAAGTVRSITWTAGTGTGIAPDQFALFRVSLKLPTTDKVSFVATQTYSDGTIVKWDQQPLPNGDEPEHPAPSLTLSAAAPASHNDDTALWLAIAALVVGAVGVVLALVRRRA